MRVVNEGSLTQTESVKVTNDMGSKIELLTQFYGVSRSELLRWLIARGLDAELNVGQHEGDDWQAIANELKDEHEWVAAGTFKPTSVITDNHDEGVVLIA